MEMNVLSQCYIASDNSCVARFELFSWRATSIAHCVAFHFRDTAFSQRFYFNGRLIARTAIYQGV